MTVDQAERYYSESFTLGQKAPPNVFNAALAKLGDPHLSVPTIHVAGTNGKGSVCAMLDAALRAAGYTVGLFTSPHLARVGERFRLNGQDMADGDFARYVGLVKTTAEGLNVRFSYFQLLTLVCFSYFRDRKPDYLILETGIGGRLDATNVIPQPLLSVITAIGYDHTDILGDTLAQIAAEKAGIIKEGRPVAAAAQTPEAAAAIARACAEKSARLYLPGGGATITQDDLTGMTFSANGYAGLRLALAGAHQLGNAETALAAVAALRDAGAAIPDAAVYDGFARVRWPGRLETIGADPLFILDGAHNIDGAKALNAAMARYLAGRRVTMVAGVLKTKEYRAMLAVLTEHAQAVVLTKPANADKAVPPNELAALTPGGKRVYMEEDCRQAVATALRVTPTGGAVVCAGSLYLVGDIRKYMMGENDDQF